jgi:hypothetical protein
VACDTRGLSAFHRLHPLSPPNPTSWRRQPPRRSPHVLTDGHVRSCKSPNCGPPDRQRRHTGIRLHSTYTSYRVRSRLERLRDRGGSCPVCPLRSVHRQPHPTEEPARDSRKPSGPATRYQRRDTQPRRRLVPHPSCLSTCPQGRMSARRKQSPHSQLRSEVKARNPGATAWNGRGTGEERARGGTRNGEGRARPKKTQSGAWLRRRSGTAKRGQHG